MRSIDVRRAGISVHISYEFLAREYLKKLVFKRLTKFGAWGEFKCDPTLVKITWSRDSFK